MLGFHSMWQMIITHMISILFFFVIFQDTLRVHSRVIM